MNADIFRCHNGGLSTALRGVKEPISGLVPVASSREVAAIALEALKGAKLPESYEVMVETWEQRVVPVPINMAGGCLHQLGHACFQGGLEDGLQRYLKWLEFLAAGHPFPTHQLRSRP